MVRTRIVVLALTEGTRVVVRQIDLGIAGWIRRVVIISWIRGVVIVRLIVVLRRLIMGMWIRWAIAR